MLTSHVPSFPGVGQQLTVSLSQFTSPRIETMKRTGKWDIALILARVPPLQHSHRLSDGERAGRILQSDDPLLVRGELSDVWMLLVLKLRTERYGGLRTVEPDARQRRVGDLEVHVAPELEVVQTAFAHELEIEEFLHHDVYAEHDQEIGDSSSQLRQTNTDLS